MVDTRVGIGGWRGHQGVGQTIEIGAAPDAAVAVTGTITLVNPGVGGYLTGTHRAASLPGATSSVNGAGRVGDGQLADRRPVAGRQPLHHLVGRAHTLFDTTGWWMPSRRGTARFTGSRTLPSGRPD